MPRSRRSPSAEPGPLPDRRRYASGTPWEPRVGYSRAVRVGDRVLVSGTTATDPAGRLVGRGDPYRQAVQTLDNIERALRALGSSLDEVVRLRVYITDFGDFEEFSRAFGERFGAIRPTNTMVRVAGLVDPAMRIEVEAEAVVSPRRGRGRALSARRPPARPRPSAPGRRPRP